MQENRIATFLNVIWFKTSYSSQYYGMVTSCMRQVIWCMFTVVHMHTLCIHIKLQLLKYLCYISKNKTTGDMPCNFRKLMEKKWRNIKVFFPVPSHVRSGSSSLNEANGSWKSLASSSATSKTHWINTVAFSRSRLLNFWKQAYNVDLFVSQRHTCLSRERRIMWKDRKLRETENKFDKTLVPSMQIS